MSARQDQAPTFGPRHRGDMIHNPGHDLITRNDGQTRAYTHAIGMARTV